MFFKTQKIKNIYSNSEDQNLLENRKTVIINDISFGYLSDILIYRTSGDPKVGSDSNVQGWKVVEVVSEYVLCIPA